MEITFKRSAGSYRAGRTINVDPRLGNALVKAGHATATEPEPDKPKAKPVAVTAPSPKSTVLQSDLNAKLKADLVEMAHKLGVALDGSETKADLISLIERNPRYSRRDMRASE